jgi:hypothetical protein
MRKLFYYSLLCAVWFGANSCKDESASTPPAPSLTVDKSSGLANDTEFTFTVNNVGSDAISILPYGLDNLNKGGILVSSFTGGQATVKFKYATIGTFNAVAVANNHSASGKVIKNTYSTPVAITISSDQNSISDFNFAGSSKVTIDQGAKTIAVVMPFRNNFVATDKTALKATFTASAFSAVTVASTAQVSGTTVNNFTSPVTYTVTSNTGVASSYVVTVTVTPVEMVTTVKSFTATAASTGIKGKAFQGAVDNVGHTVVILDTLGIGATTFDSVALKYALDGKFATVGVADSTLDQGDVLDLSSSIAMTVHSEDSVATSQDYTIYSAAAPKLKVEFLALNPQVWGYNNQGFAATLDVLNGTDVTTLATTTTFAYPAGVTPVSMTVDSGAGPVAFVSGGIVDFSAPVKLGLLVNDTNLGISYTVVYTISVPVVK